MNLAFSQQSYRSRKLIQLFTNRTSLHSYDQQSFQRKQDLPESDIEQNAKQSLLNIQQNQLTSIPNPQRNFMKLTRHLKFNSSPKNIDFQTFSFIDDHDQEILVKRNKLKKNKFSTISIENNSKHLLPLKKATLHNQRSQSRQNKNTETSSIRRLQQLIVRNNSNLLTPRQRLPSIISSQNYNVLKKRTKSPLKPYSVEKIHKNIRVMSVIKFKEDISLLPVIEKELRRNRLLGYS